MEPQACATPQTPDVVKTRCESIAEQDIDYHLRQFRNPYRSTIALGRLISSHIGSLNGEALDVACGAGANMFYFSRLFPGLRWTGVDMAGDFLFRHSRELFLQCDLDASLITGDFYRLKELTEHRKYDLVLSLQTMLTQPSYEEALEQLLLVTSKWLVISSLFTEFQVDARIDVIDYTWPATLRNAYYYSVFSMPRLRAFCEARGAKEVTAYDFEIDSDLPPPANLGLGTYTRLVDQNHRLQFTGPIYMPWKFVFIRM